MGLFGWLIRVVLFFPHPFSLISLFWCCWWMTQEKVVAPRALVQPGEGMGGREEGCESGSFFFFFQISLFGVISYKITQLDTIFFCADDHDYTPSHLAYPPPVYTHIPPHLLRLQLYLRLQLQLRSPTTPDPNYNVNYDHNDNDDHSTKRRRSSTNSVKK